MVDSKTSLVEEVQHVEEKAHDPIDTEEQLVNEKEVMVDPEPHSHENHIPAVTEPASSTAQKDAPKESYASILSSQAKKGVSGPAKVYVPANTSRVALAKTEKQSLGSTAHASVLEASVPSASGIVDTFESGNAQEEVEGHSIYVRNLPLNMTVTQLEMEFKKFGPIKQGGVQVRSNKQQGFCFGFVEFQSLSSMSDAIEASPITIEDRRAVVEMKRTTTRVVSGRGRFPSGRGGFQGDGFRGRGHFGGGRGYVRNEFGSRGDFSGRPSGRGREGYQQGRGRGGRRGGLIQNDVST